jgi:hypothetical protein
MSLSNSFLSMGFLALVVPFGLDMGVPFSKSIYFCN